MLQCSPRRRLMIAPVALVALVAAVGGPASASRPKAGDALARAVAVQINASASVVAEARGDQANRSSGASLTVPEILEVRTAESVAETRVRSGLRARAETHLGGVRLKVSTARIQRLTDRALTEAEASVREVLRTACAAGVRVEAEAVAAATVRSVAHADAGTPFGGLRVEGSLEAELRAEVRAVLDGEDLGRPVCEGRTHRLAGRVVAAIEPAVRAAIDAHLSIPLTALRTECDLGRRAGTARTELLVHQRTAALLGLDGELDGDGVLIEAGPNTGVNLGGGVSLVLNEQRRTNRAGREAHIVVNGVVLRVDGVVVATLASSQCQLRGDVVIESGGEDGMLTVAPEADLEGLGAELQVEADLEARLETEGRVGAQGSVAAREERWSRLASFEAGAYVRATGHF